MINLALDVWVKRQLSTVEEDGSAVARIQMNHPDANQTYATWTAPFEDVDAMISEIQGLFDTLPDEWAVGNHQVVLVAQDRDQLDLARYPKTLRGKNRGASNNLLATEGQASVAATATAISELQRNSMSLANAQLSHAQRMHENDRKQIQEQYEYIKALQQQSVIEKAETENQDDKLKAAVTGLLTEQAPMLLDIWKMSQEVAADNSKIKLAATAASAVTNGKIKGN